MNSKWTKIPGYEDLYLINKKAEVFSLVSNRLLTPYRFEGYVTVGLTKNRKTLTLGLHRLIARTFIPNPLHRKEVNHKNGVRDDNRIENLEWCTRGENNLHAFRVLHRPPTNFKKWKYPDKIMNGERYPYCSRCHVYKHNSQFYKASDRTRGYRCTCKACDYDRHVARINSLSQNKVSQKEGKK
jgi:hypothetical protein